MEQVLWMPKCTSGSMWVVGSTTAITSLTTTTIATAQATTDTAIARRPTTAIGTATVIIIMVSIIIIAAPITGSIMEAGIILPAINAMAGGFILVLAAEAITIDGTTATGDTNGTTAIGATNGTDVRSRWR